MPVARVFDGKRYTIWSRHKTKTNATKSAKKMRLDGYLARVFRNIDKLKTKRERSHPWEVYVRRKPSKGPIFTMRRK